MAASQPLIVGLDGVERSFGAVRALGGVDLACRAGECLGLVGHNGAGKSTLMAVLAGTLAPDRGTIRVDGVDATAGGAWSQRSATGALRVPGAVALPEPDRGRERAGRARGPRPRLAAARWAADRRAAGRDLSRPRHRGRRSGRRPRHRAAPAGRDRARLHRDGHAGPAGDPGRADLVPGRSWPTSSWPSCAGSWPAAGRAC